MPAPMLHIAFYKFVRLPEPEGAAAVLRELTPPLLGSILLAHEGINGMLAGSAEALDAFEQALQTDARLHGAFGGTVFKRTTCQTVPFARLKIHVKPELVPLGIDGVDATAKTGVNVSPQDWRELIKQEDVVLLDNRNHFEFELGRFHGAMDPQVHNFRDFAQYVLAHADAWRAQNKRVAMYCTGGIRCEKSSAWMVDLGLPVYQLEGGILNYFAQMPDAEKDWQGECFVFDNRIALDTHLQETGTTAEDVYAGDPQEAWRLQRARRLDEGQRQHAKHSPASDLTF
ncbi:MAG: rhodanese-related sulfurtransferase [Burkholderiaceae bacterium]